MSIVVVGSVAFDSVQTPFGSRDFALGGAANYFSMAASFFSKINLVAVVGQDFPKGHIKVLQEKGVNTEGLQVKAGETFHWIGKYEYDLNSALTIDTKLNVFADFSPQLPSSYKNSDIVFLANIDPSLQLSVLNQVNSPKIKALDTMNFWIEGKNEELLEVIKRVDILLINDAEIRELTKETNMIKAAKWVQNLGPKTVVIKRGEYGALLFHEKQSFFVPAMPAENIFDPTGAGDTFAGGFLGWLAKCSDLSFENYCKAMIVGSTMASFVIEDFSFDKIKKLTLSEIQKRCNKIQNFSHISSKIDVLS